MNLAIPRFLPPDCAAVAVAEYTDGKSLQAIAAKHGWKMAHIRSAIMAAGVEIRRGTRMTPGTKVLRYTSVAALRRQLSDAHQRIRQLELSLLDMREKYYSAVSSAARSRWG
jgi:hypothetical protein